MLENPSSTHPDFDETWRRMESLVDELAQWAGAAESFPEFYGLLLQRTVTELKVAGGAVWHLDSRQRALRADMIGSPSIDALTRRPAHLAGIQAAFQSHAVVGQPRTEAPARQRQRAASVATDEGFQSCLAPVVVDDAIVAVVELVLAADATVACRENAEHVLAALADVAVDFHRAAQLRALRHQVAAWDAAQEFSDCVHRRLDLEETCYAIANEGRRFVGADRVSLLVGRVGSLRIRAISGVEGIDRRSPEVIIMRKLAKAVAPTGEALWTQDAIDQPPQIQQLLNAYHDASGIRCSAMIPLMSEPLAGKSRLLGVLVAEQFASDKFDSNTTERLAICCRQAKTALANALEMNSLPLLWLSRSLRSVAWLFGFQSITLFALVLVIVLHLVGGAIAALCLVPVDFTITARGHLQPATQQEIFAPADGVVEATMVQHGAEVERGDALVRLRNLELDYETERLRGDIATTKAKLMAVQAARVMDGRQKVVQHNAEIERYKQMLVGMKQQYKILERQHESLTVRSTFAGQVTSWETDKTLVLRPVRQGQRLMTIAQVRGPWRLEVEVADEDIGHVLHASGQRGDDDLPVTFILLTDPAVAHTGRVADVALGTIVTSKREPIVRVIVEVDAAALTSPRPGAGVVARIHCGQRPIGFVWFRGFYEKLRMRLMFFATGN